MKFYGIIKITIFIASKSNWNRWEKGKMDKKNKNFNARPNQKRIYKNTGEEKKDRSFENENANEGLVIGRNAVRELLKSGRDIDKIFVQRGEREGSIVVLVAEAIERHIPIVEVEKKEYCSVQDILAIARERGEKPFVVIADGITDPHNLGALIRCAEGVGAHGLIIPKRRAVGLTPAVTKASCGAIEHLAVAKVTNLAATVEELKQEGLWIFAAEAGGEAYYNTDFNCPCALVMGSEGEGVSRLLKEKADFIVSIPMYGHVNSFNVSTAAAVILAEISRQHKKT